MQNLFMNNAGGVLEKIKKELVQFGTEEKEAAWRINLSDKVKKDLKEKMNIEWKNCRLLDIGCGQLLRHALIFGIDNKIIGIDVELPFKYPYITDFFKIMLNCGMHRAIKTAVRQISGIDRRFRRSLKKHLKIEEFPEIEMHLMDAMNLDFADNSFDGAYSFSVFQLINEPATAAREMYRVLKPGGVGYIQLHLYTSIGGSDHPLLKFNPEKYPPWGHLRASTDYYLKHGVNVNCWRICQYKELFEQIFEQVYYIDIEDEKEHTRKYLTPDIRKELSEYSEEELLTSTFSIICAKAPKIVC